MSYRAEIYAQKKSSQHNCCRFLVICCELGLITILSQHQGTTKIVPLATVTLCFGLNVGSLQKHCVIKRNGCEIRYKLLITINNDSLTTLMLWFCCILMHFGITTVVKSLQHSQKDYELSNATVVL